MKETKLYAKLKPHFDQWGIVDRVENALGSGMSDIFYNFSGNVGWIETKLMKKGELYFEKFQPNWIRRHVRQGFPRMFIIAMDEEETIYLWNAIDVISTQPRSYGKWTVYDAEEARMPLLMMTKPYSSNGWAMMRQSLIS